MTKINPYGHVIPRNSLDGYVTTETGIVIYNAVKAALEDSNFDITILDFMNNLYKDLWFFISNRRKYLIIEEYIAEKNLEGKLKFLYLDFLIICINLTIPEELEDRVVYQSFKYLEDQRWISLLEETNSDNYFGFQFNSIRSHLSTLTDDLERKKYLLKSKAAYEAFISVPTEGAMPIFFKTFPIECNIELSKIETLLQLVHIDNQFVQRHKNVQEESDEDLGPTIIEEPLIRKLRNLFDGTVWEKEDAVKDWQFLNYWRLGKRGPLLPIKNKTNFIHLIRRLTDKGLIENPKQKDFIETFQIRNYANLLHAIKGKDYSSEMKEINQKVDLIRKEPKFTN